MNDANELRAERRSAVRPACRAECHSGLWRGLCAAAQRRGGAGHAATASRQHPLHPACATGGAGRAAGPHGQHADPATQRSAARRHRQPAGRGVYRRAALHLAHPAPHGGPDGQRVATGHANGRRRDVGPTGRHGCARRLGRALAARQRVGARRRASAAAGVAGLADAAPRGPAADHAAARCNWVRPSGRDRHRADPDWLVPERHRAARRHSVCASGR